MRNLFRKHGELSLLDISLYRDDEGLVLLGSDTTILPVHLVQYSANDFNAISSAELLGLVRNNWTHVDSNVYSDPSETNLPVYFLIGGALVEYLDDKLHPKLDDSSNPEKYDRFCYLELLRRQRRAHKVKTAVYEGLVQFVLSVSMAAKYLLSASSFIRSTFLWRIMSQFTSIAVLSGRVLQFAQWSDRYRAMKLQRDVLEYLRMRHELRQSVWSFVVDLLSGILQFIFLRKIVVYSVNFMRVVTRATYVSIIKYLSYNFAMRIGKYCKLNNEVAAFLSRLIISMLVVWSVIVPKLHESFLWFSRLFQYSALFGITCEIAVLADIVTIETLHMAYAHCILLFITKWMHRYKFSLLQLIKGKKWNELKQALDSNEYTREQLFLGTVMFSLLLLIYPTIWVFYCVTLVVYLPVIVVKILLRSVIQVITMFPSYYLVYNVLFPNRYKEGIYFVHEIVWPSSLYGMEGWKLDLFGVNRRTGVVNKKGSGRTEIRCGSFSARTFTQPIIQGLKSCKSNLCFWRT
ncbi:N-acetylglucosaminyl-phosphatidylinositol biosynthetic protein gpi1 [Babesia sp. Xinjiang]|uniref:N-acetylglucosaminyl-phosphatidylinositol biosynthetic protein gpi1 n=1 Tax=Babesia sp. Xinjiang TaxID=462227 RepID=UPI000A2429CB|nr:N-acetylglucosaminyl-phosphatidylinositol biosynthetic protein gpi1 [Babesia sp. Xinjiang]ORM40075.1 N-acetylglucosaminyl-phosphatidylinositol biosynthetic protein gpi1 [Babesia sp. Xinjiang]